MKKYNELIKDLKKIEKQGFVKTHRGGNTDIGKTLEDLLGIEENNIAGPNGHQTELKSARTGIKLYHNFIRPHSSLDNDTPYDRAGIEIKGNNKWLVIIQNASIKQ